jgi:hypothetical protein
VDGFRIRTATLIVAALLIGIGAGLATGVFGSDEDPAPSSTAATGDVGEDGATRGRSDGEDGGDPPREPELPRTEEDPQGLEPGPSGPAPESADELAAARAARGYIEAIDDRAAKRLCAAFEPAADEPQERLEVPRRRGSCAASFKASFGHKGAGGQPVWSSSRMTPDVSAQIEGDEARVVATIFTEYADVREPTIEDDIIYLSRATDRWLVVKPSATLYRAVGIADIPLEALEPPAR